jgi:hypothetical protein
MYECESGYYTYFRMRVCVRVIKGEEGGLGCQSIRSRREGRVQSRNNATESACDRHYEPE